MKNSNRENTKRLLPAAVIIAIIFIIAAALFLFFGKDGRADFFKKYAGTEGNVNLSKLELRLDDEAYIIEKDDTVIIPAGRPRVPQIICETKGVQVYQAFFPDDRQAATAVIRAGNEERVITFIKDAKKGIEFQYDDRIQFDTDIASPVYSSSNAEVAMVTLAGQIIITGVSDEGVTITATNGIESAELVITRTVKAPIGVYLLTGQSNAAYYFADPKTASVTKKGAAYVYDISEGIYSIQSMNHEDGSMARGNVEAGIIKSIYDNLGEKVLVVNTGKSGEKIETFVPGGSTYKYIEEVFSNLSYIFDTDWFKARFEPRMRSYIWIQGESDDWLQPEVYMENYLQLHRVLRSSMYGFDYGFISQIVPRFFRPNDAQERLAQGYDDIFMATRRTNHFSVETGELRTDNLHYTQKGDNLIGEDIGNTISMVYKGNSYLLPE